MPENRISNEHDLIPPVGSIPETDLDVQRRHEQNVLKQEDEEPNKGEGSEKDNRAAMDKVTEKVVKQQEKEEEKDKSSEELQEEFRRRQFGNRFKDQRG